MFEIPYNFDIKLIDALKNLNLEYSTYKLYVLPFFEDSYSTIRHLTLGYRLVSMTREEYEYHINLIRESIFKDKMLLLLQEKKPISNDILKYYVDLGFKSFCVGSIELAKIIKELYPKFEVIASITMNLTEEDIVNNINEYKKYFDGIVLMFLFNRDIEAIKRLPKDLFYIIIVNNRCSVYCDGQHHWFGKLDDLLANKFECPVRNDLEWDHITTIDPWDLDVFDPYIKHYKIQGRGISTPALIRDILSYENRFIYKNIKPDESKYLKRW